MSSDKTLFQLALSVDNVIFGFDEQVLKILLIKRGFEPFLGSWALPGDFIDPHENLRDAPLRILERLVGVKDVFLEQVKTFGKVNRHPFGRVITVSYYSLININSIEPRATSKANEIAWIPIHEVSDLVFDHEEIIHTCLARLQDSVLTRPIGFELLPKKFTLSQLQKLYEAVLGKSLDKRNFRKKFLTMNILRDIDEVQTGVAHRPAKYYSFDEANYERLKSQGFSFDL